MNAIMLTALAMMAFAANSVLCRLALGAGLIDAASFLSCLARRNGTRYRRRDVNDRRWNLVGVYSLLGRGSDTQAPGRIVCDAWRSLAGSRSEGEIRPLAA